MKTRVIGLGNPILTDDSVGIHVAQAVRLTLSPYSGIDVVELCVGGLALMEAMIGYDRIILIDGFWTPDVLPGQIEQFTAENLADTLNTSSSHDVDLLTALQVGRQLGAHLPSNESIEVVAIGVKDVLTFGEEPTPNVAMAIPLAVRTVQVLLQASSTIHYDFKEVTK